LIAFSSEAFSSSSLNSQIITPPSLLSRTYSALPRSDCGSS